MDATLISGLLVAAVSGLTVLAYKDFDAYRKLFIYVVSISSGFAIATYSSYLTCKILGEDIVQYVIPEREAFVRGFMQGFQGGMWRVFVGTSILASYLYLLVRVFGEIHKEKHQQNNAAPIKGSKTARKTVEKSKKI